MSEKQDIKCLLLNAVKASVQAGKAIMEVYASDDFQVETKEDDSPLTKADKAAHDVICKLLEKSGLPVLSEEGKKIPYEERKNRNLFWLVDPLDGTKEFVKRNNDFTVNIALIEKKLPLAGVIYIPVEQNLYFAEHALGAYKIDLSDTQIELFDDLDTLIKKSKKLPFCKTKKMTLVGSRSHLNAETEAFFKEFEKKYGDIEIISRGSSLKFCMIAEGKADYYPRFGPTMEWDIAAGHCIVCASGGSVYRADGAKLLYNKENLLNPYFIAHR